MEEQIYPIGLQDFEKIRQNNMVYVDKTRIIYDLVKVPRYIFLARPRRFGKSVLLSTIHYYFEGRKDLFEGLSISELEKEWISYPVFHIELSGAENNIYESLTEELSRQFSMLEKKYGIEKGSNVLSSRFKNLIQEVAEKTGKKVVILIDEYDNALINSLEDRELHEKFKNLLKSVYSALKSMDRYIRFGMITGVSRFSRTSIFSGINNLYDITFHVKYNAICGFTQEELGKYFSKGVEKLALKRKITKEEVLNLLKREYDGYHFTQDSADIYNPYSVLYAFDQCEIKNYWVESGTPEFLVKALENSDLDFSSIFKAEENEQALSTNDINNFSPVALLYQTGYLTIKSYDSDTGIFKLGVPNKEVNTGLFSYLLLFFTKKDGKTTLKVATKLRASLIEGRPEEFIIELRAFFAGVPYPLSPEKYELNFEKVLYSLLRLIELDVRAEVATSRGRIDLLVTTDDFIYVIELKVDKSASEGLKQIKENEYSLPWKNDRRKIFKIGINISGKTRNIESWEIKED